MTKSGFTPLEDFWSDFFEMTVRGAPPPREEQAVAGYLSTIFGDLVEHEFRRLDTLPFTIDCTNCRNNTSGPVNEAVCKTHVGVIKGVAQAMTHVPMSASYEPADDGACTIRLEVARAPDGAALTAYAKRLDHLDACTDGASFWLYDRSDGSTTGLTGEAYAVLAALTEEKSAAQLAQLTRFPETGVRQILDQCYAQGLVQCRFAPQAEG